MKVAFGVVTAVFLLALAGTALGQSRYLADPNEVVKDMCAAAGQIYASGRCGGDGEPQPEPEKSSKTNAPLYCDGMARPAVDAPCPDARAEKIAGMMDQFPGIEKAAICDVWARNAVTGGSAALRNKPRVIIPLKEGAILEMLEHGTLFNVEGIAVWEEDMKLAPEFMAESIFFGYDFVKRTAPENMPASAEEAHGIFMEVCMSREDV